MSEAEHRTPAGLRLVEAFINSTGPAAAEIENGLAGWCLTSGLCADPSPEALRQLRAFRAALLGMLEANAGLKDRAAAWAAVEPFALETRYRIRIESGAPRLRADGGGTLGAIGSLLASLYEAGWRNEWPRLKACRDERCRRAFYDRSKNGSAAWCSMAVCGNRMKAKRRRFRTKNPA